MRTLFDYEHQKDAISAILTAKKGIIHLPTGTGKTRIISGSIIDKINRGEKVFVICSPRIILSNQIVNDIYETLSQSKIDAEYLCVRSGEKAKIKGKLDFEALSEEEEEELDNIAADQFWDEKAEWDVDSSTNTTKIADKFVNAKKDNKPLIISCVYDSVRRIRETELKIGPFVENIYYDEAHYLCSRKFNEILDWFSEINAYSFTATLKTTASNSGFGMNNEERFGPLLYRRSPAQMVEAGIIVRPRIHIVYPENGILTKKDALPKDLVIQAFEGHKKALQKKVGAKMLVICESTTQLVDLFFSLFPTNGKKDPRMKNISIFAVGSGIGNKLNGGFGGVGGCWKVPADTKVNENNNFNMSRKDWLSDLKSLKDEDDAIIFHINILTEGIDVPGITGILPFKSLKLSKFLQNLGRATRLTPKDRKKLSEKKLSTDFEKGYVAGKDFAPEAQKYQKPYAWVIIPWVSALDTDLEQTYKNYIHNLRDFNFSPEEDIMEQRLGKNDDEEADKINSQQGIYSSFTGKIEKLLIKDGTMVEKKCPLLTFTMPNVPMEIPFSLPEDKKGLITFKVKEGQQVKQDELIATIAEEKMSLVSGFSLVNHELESEQEAIKFWNSRHANMPWEIEKLKRTQKGEYIQTPMELAQKMASKLIIEDDGAIIDPWCKSGNLLIGFKNTVVGLCHDDYSFAYTAYNLTGKMISELGLQSNELYDYIFIYSKNILIINIKDNSLDENYGIFMTYLEREYKLNFKYCIMNPPYGNKHLPILKKMTEEIVDKRDGTVVSIQPVRWLQDPLVENKKKTDYKIYEPFFSGKVEDIEFISRNNGFDAAIGTDLGILKLNKNASLNLKDMKYSYLGYSFKSIYNKVFNKYPSLEDYLEENKRDGIRVKLNIIKGLCGTGGSALKVDNKGYIQILTNLIGNQQSQVYNDGFSDDGRDWTETVNKNKYSKEKGDGIPYSIKFTSKVEALNFILSTKTIMFKFIMFMVMRDVNIPHFILPFMVDYSQPWTDERFYKFFSLAKEEIQTIENWAKENGIQSC
jgi:superfamily II DNA or RNA helicase